MLAALLLSVFSCVKLKAAQADNVWNSN